MQISQIPNFLTPLDQHIWGCPRASGRPQSKNASYKKLVLFHFGEGLFSEKKYGIINFERPLGDFGVT
jgi:hypothetical protein